MRNVRVHVSQPLALQQETILDERAAHYLKHVLRLRENDTVQVFDGTGGCYEAVISRIARDTVAVVPREFRNEDRESGLDLCLAHGLARGQRMDYTIQKAVELGVRRIVPLLTEHVQVRLGPERTDKRLAHWQGVIASACEQCGRNRLPVIEAPVSLSDWVEADDAAVKLVLWPEAASPLGDAASAPAAVSLLCGPEGGLSRRDLETAGAGGYRPVRLGPRILRTETAAVAALAVCQALWGDLC